MSAIKTRQRTAMDTVPTVFDIFDRVFGFDTEPRTHQDARTRWMLPVDIYEKAENTVIRASVPGVSREDLSVTFKDGVLTIEATAHVEEGVDHERYFRREVRTGTWSRSLRLPDDIDTDNISASLEDGVLRLTLPRRSEVQPRVIAIG